ncbi:MAG: TAXI family TRAP transporter solute-binding subunit, partial [Planctomycetota bacterium]
MESKRPDRSRKKLWVGALVLLAFGLVLTTKFVEPPPPQVITLAAGGKGGAYHASASRLSDLLAESGVEARVLETAGSLENADRIRESGGETFGFVQGGTLDPEVWADLRVVAALYYEPVWVFYRKKAFPADLALLTELAGRRIGVGPVGSGTRKIALDLLGLNGVDRAGAQLIEATSSRTAELLREGELDAGFFVAGPSAPLVKGLLLNEDIELMSFTRHLAYARRISYLKAIDLAEGVIDLRRKVPRQRTVLLAPTAALLAHKKAHPAVVELLCRANVQLFAAGGLVESRGEFPDPFWDSQFVSDETAVRYLTEGPSLLSRYLPFWAIRLLRRLLVFVVPLLTVMIPLFKIAPAIYRWRVNRRIVRWYDDLIEIERQLPGVGTGHEGLDGLAARLQALDERVEAVEVPLAYQKDLFGLRLHVELIARRIDAAREGTRLLSYRSR